MGLESEIELSAQSRVAMLYERFHRDGGDRKDSGELRYSRDLNPNWTLDLAVAHLDRVVLSRPEDTGTRTDLGARLTWTRDDDLKIYGFGQGTVSRSGQVSRNNRLGLGFETRLTESCASPRNIPTVRWVTVVRPASPMRPPPTARSIWAIRWTRPAARTCAS